MEALGGAQRLRPDLLGRASVLVQLEIVCVGRPGELGAYGEDKGIQKGRVTRVKLSFQDDFAKIESMTVSS